MEWKAGQNSQPSRDSEHHHHHIPSISRSNNRKPSTSSSSIVNSESEQRELFETIIGNLPLETNSTRSSSLTTRFLFGLLRTTNILNASEACRAALEKKIGLQLEQATLDDLLIPSYSYLNETLYDVDCVERILSYFLRGFEERNWADNGDNAEGELRSPALMLVGKLIDGYLSEIASDANLKPDKFCKLAISLPDQAHLSPHHPADPTAVETVVLPMSHPVLPVVVVRQPGLAPIRLALLRAKQRLPRLLPIRPRRVRHQDHPSLHSHHQVLQRRKTRGMSKWVRW